MRVYVVGVEGARAITKVLYIQVSRTKSGDRNYATVPTMNALITPKLAIKKQHKAWRSWNKHLL